MGSGQTHIPGHEFHANGWDMGSSTARANSYRLIHTRTKKHILTVRRLGRNQWRAQHPINVSLFVDAPTKAEACRLLCKKMGVKLPENIWEGTNQPLRTTKGTGQPD